jgi:PIN domain nuclease of toxin-antitoxin system
MRLLLDTHVLLWWLADDPVLSTPARAAIASEPEVFASAASAWEIAIKSSLGRRHLPMDPAEYVRTWLRQSQTFPLAITHEHALRVASLPARHRLKGAITEARRRRGRVD